MPELIIYVLRFIAGGALVCVFALVSEVWQPKRFAGTFSAAPSVLLTGLAITLLSQGAAASQLTAEGAIAGAFGMVAYCLCATPAIRRLKPLLGSGLMLPVWFVVALGVYAVITRGVGS
jgi:hypothetical protein